MQLPAVASTSDSSCSSSCSFKSRVDMVPSPQRPPERRPSGPASRAMLVTELPDYVPTVNGQTMTVTINVDVEPIEIDSKHFVSLRTNGREWKREGPFADAVTARAAADRQIRRWRKAAMGNGAGVSEAAAGKPAPILPRTIPADTTNSDNKPAKRSSKHKRSPGRQAHPQTSNVASVPTTSSFLDDSELIEDLARYAENVLSEKEVRKRHRLTGRHRSRKHRRFHRRNDYSTFYSVGRKTRSARGISISSVPDRPRNDEKQWPRSRCWSGTAGWPPFKEGGEGVMGTRRLIGELPESSRFIRS